MAMLGIEIVKILLLIIIALEGAMLIYAKDEEEEKSVRTSRREVYGTFHNPLGDTYRKNTKNHYDPIKPNSKWLDGDDEE